MEYTVLSPAQREFNETYVRDLRKTMHPVEFVFYARELGNFFLTQASEQEAANDRDGVPELPETTR